jgi:hypothetical protein
MDKRYCSVLACSFAVVFATFLIKSRPAFAQSSSGGPSEHGEYFLYGGVGTIEFGEPHQQRVAPTTVGGGGEARVTEHLAVATEVGGVNSYPGSFGMLAGRVLYHPIGEHEHRFDLSIGAGYAAYMSRQAAHRSGPDITAGGVWWLAAHHNYNLGFGLEARAAAGMPMRELRVSIRLWQ